MTHAGRLMVTGIAAAVCAAAMLFGSADASHAQASRVKYVINNVAVTTGDVQKRQNLMRLFNQKGDAGEQMIEQALKSGEAARLNIRIPPQAVEGAFANLAKSNKLTVAQMEQAMGQRGVDKKHFLEFIRVQMAWSQALGARYRATGMMTEQEMVQKVFELGGRKPSATEYMLQKVVFVVPNAERNAILGKRKREAEAFRLRYNGCDTARDFAKGLIDVTVQDIPRVLEPELPPDWSKQIKETKPGSATTVRETPAGIEFIGICSSREVSDDRAAQMMLQSDGKLDEKAEALSKKYLAELREKARIQTK